MLKKILNKKEAMEYLNIGRARLDAEIKSGHIRFKIIGKRLMFPLWTLDEWLNDTTKHIDCTKSKSQISPCTNVILSITFFKLSKFPAYVNLSNTITL